MQISSRIGTLCILVQRVCSHSSVHDQMMYMLSGLSGALCGQQQSSRQDEHRQCDCDADEQMKPGRWQQGLS